MTPDTRKQIKSSVATFVALGVIVATAGFLLRPGQESLRPQRAELKPYFSREQSFIGRGTVENLDLADYAAAPKDTALSPPKSIWVIAGSGTITVNWTRQTLADHYRLKYTELGGKKPQVALVEAPFFSLRNVTPDQAYRFSVSSVDSDGNQSTSSPALTVTAKKLKQTQKVAKNDFQVAAWMPSDPNAPDTKASFERALGTLTEINPFWYNFSSDGVMEPKGGARDPGLVARAHQNGMRIIPTITNNFDAERMTNLFGDQRQSDKLIKDLVHEAVVYDYDGIDLDFENMTAADRDHFTDLIKKLAEKLHSQKKVLEVTVQPKKSDKDNWEGPGALDAKALGQAADRIKIMTYDYSRPDTKPGPIAPPSWIKEVINYWQTKVADKKILAGVPLYGYDWATQTGEAQGIDWDSVERLKKKYDVKEGVDPMSGEPFFSYDAEDGPHIAYYQDPTSLTKKVAAIKETGVAGVAAWVLGGDHPNNFLAIAGATKKIQNEITRPVNIGLKLDGQNLAVSLSKFNEIESFIVEYGESPAAYRGRATPADLGAAGIQTAAQAPSASVIKAWRPAHRIGPVKQSIVPLTDLQVSNLRAGQTYWIRARALDHSGREIGQSGLAQVSF